jgi:membrane protein insertase, YidC/Oxa1 family, N-terminal domain
MDTQKIILFVVLSFSILMLWEAWNKEQQPVSIQAKPGTAVESAVPAPAVKTPATQSVESGIQQTGQRVRVKTDALYVEIDTVGGDIRRLELLKHKDAQDKSKNFLLLEDDAQHPYIAQSGLLGEGLPTHKTTFTAEGYDYALASGAKELQVRLHWQNAEGVKVTKVFTFHPNSYVIDVSYDVVNGAGTPLAPSAYYQLVRTGQPPKEDSKLLHTYTGPAFYTEQAKFRKVSFEDIENKKAELPGSSHDGWVAVLQHYFLSAWLPESSVGREFYAKTVGKDLYSVGVLLESPAGTIQPAGSGRIGASLYAGPQEQTALKKLAPGLDLTVDYGWLTVIAAPLYWVLDKIQRLVHNWGVAIIILTVLIKLAFFPLSAKSYRSMANMRKLTPKLQKLKEQYGDDRQRMNQAMMELYKTEKINPLGGCLPVVVQIPVFIALYWVLLYSVEMRQAPFYGWITDLSASDPYFVLPVLMGITMLVQTKLNPTPPDPIQAKVMLIMPFAMSIFFVFFPAGLVLYWVVNNLLSIGQQWYITRKMERAAH